MNILVTLERGKTWDVHFPEESIEMLKELGNVMLNCTYEKFTQDYLISIIRDVDVCVTHWGCPKFTREVIENATRLKLITHAAGSVADTVTDYVYDMGIKVCSANNIMAKYVAEGTLAYIFAGLRLIPQHDRRVKDKVLWERMDEDTRNLIGAKLGLIGLGTVGRFLVEFLKPFDVNIKIYDPYIPKDSLKDYSNVQICSMDEVLSWGDVISIHASLTQETYNLINNDKLKLIKDNSLVVNTARGAIIDQSALTCELQRGRLNAVLDVFDEEPLPLDDPLRGLNNVILMPHMAGVGAREQMTYAMIGEIKRYIGNEPLKYEISYEKYILMTREE